jgi:hypothetical protein
VEGTALARQAPDEQIAAMAALLEIARPMMEDKCCHFDWCIERRGIVSENQAEGFHDIINGMHPGCAPYRQWLDGYDAVVGAP